MFAKTFRNTLIASTLVVAGAALANPAMAATEGSVGIQGEVVSTTAITVSDTAPVLNLYGVGTAGSDTVVKVSDLGILSNNAQGVTVTATAAGSLTSTNGGTGTLAYKVLIVENDATPAAADFSLATDSDFIAVGGTGLVDGAAARDLFIEYDAPNILDPGLYSSSITVNIVDGAL